jgi:AmmeMemoRadiSam system protein A
VADPDAPTPTATTAPPEPSALVERGAVLLVLARTAIVGSFERDRGLQVATAGDPPGAAWLDELAATFVTLRTVAGELRGCIGTLEAYRPLREDVVANARAAAFGDPRFPPLRALELTAVRIEVSLLSRPEPLSAVSEGELLAQLRPGIDGLLLARGPRRATFLPQVWEEVADPWEFLRHLQRKAGLGPGWEPGTAAWRYQVHKWAESERAADRS